MFKLERELTKIGFNRLQEKEDCVYFEKMIEQSKDETHQICIVYDKKKKKIKSMDTFMINDVEMKMVQNDRSLKNVLTHLLSS